MRPKILMLNGRLWAAEKFAYFGAALWALTFHERPGLFKVTMGPVATDRWYRTYYDPEYLEKNKTSEELVGGILLHEVSHLVRAHWERLERRLPPLWNIAGDLEINDDLARSQIKLPPGAMFPSVLNLPPSKTAEWYYEKLQKNVKVSGNCGSCARGGKDEFEDPDAGHVTPAHAQLIRMQVAAAVQGSPPGTVSAGLQRWAEATLDSKVPWQQLLGREIRGALRPAMGMVNYSYTRPSRRRIPGVVLPRLIGYKPHIAIVMDTSGSMGSSDLNKGYVETVAICKALAVEPRVHFVDAEALGYAKGARDFQRKLKGGGGTDMRLGIRVALKERPQPNVVVVITDGETPWPEAEPKAKVIVCLTRKGAVGEVPKWARWVLAEEEGEEGASDYDISYFFR